MRRREILGLRWEAIGPDRIRVRRALVRGFIATTKSGKSREVPVSDPLRRVLDASVVIDTATWNRAQSVAEGFEKKADIPIRGRRETQDVYALPMRSDS